MKGYLFVVLVGLLASAQCQDVPVCEDGVEFLPHPTDCNKYYACSAGVALELACPDGLEWNNVGHYCDFPESSGCSIVSTSTTDDPTQTTTDSTSITSSTTIDSTATTSPGTETTTSNSTDSSTFPTEGTDTTTSSTASTSTTTVSSTTGPSTEAPGGLPDSCPAVDDPNRPVRLPHPTNCDLYFLCKEGAPVLYSCQAGGNHFSPTERVCLNVDVAGCDRCPKVEVEGEVVRLPHETNCHWYYKCESSEPALYQCTLDLQFSRDVRTCLEPVEAKCNLQTVIH